MDCVNNIDIAKAQPLESYDNIMWILAETYFRKGNGENVTFEQVWKENKNLNIVTFDYLFKKIKEEYDGRN